MVTKTILVLLTLLSLGLASSQLPSCNGCLGLEKSPCEATNGCFFSATRTRCENACQYPDISSCNVCNQTCNWVGGVIDTCIVRWDVSFTMCFVVDDSESIDSGLPSTNTPEWDVIRNVFIKGVVDAVSPPSCDPVNPATSRNCPRVGVVQFNADSLVVVPEITKAEPQYATFGNMSVCFGPNTTLPILRADFKSRVDSMLRGVDRDTGNSGGSTFTLRGVSRCVDLLVNTMRVDPRAVQLLVLESDGPPNGPLSGCVGTCTACDTDDVKTRVFDDISNPLFAASVEHKECEPKWWNNQTEWRSQFGRSNRQVITQFGIKTYNVYFKSDTNPPAPALQCLTNINEPRNSQTSITTADLVGFANGDATAIRNVIDGAVKIGNTICEFETLPPTSSPTFNPTSNPSQSPSVGPTSNPTSNPTRNPTKNPTRNPTSSPTDNPTNKPSANPSKNPTRNPSKNPTQSPTTNPTANPTKNPSANPSANPTQNPTKNPTANPTNNPTANPTANPTKNPSAKPTKNPTQNPTGSPTPNPTANPTKNPTVSPTTCQQREVPNFQRRNCLDENGCTGSAAAVTVSNNGNPVSVNANTAAGTTTVCYTLNIPTSLASPCSDAQFRALRGVSFVVDECCPAPSMEFLESVRVGESVSTNREQCVEGNVSGAFDSLCTRTRRPCVANSNEMCSVLNVNGLNEPAGTSVQYCITVQGTNFDLNPPPNEIDPDVRGTAKMCFERGVENPRGPLNVCTCVQVGFIDSQRLCNSTAAPSAGPTQTPTANPTKNPTSNPTNNPTQNPTANPTQDPTSDPSPTPTSGPTANPTKNPTSNPTQDPTADPTRNPTRNPTKNPTKNPTSNPTLSPTPCRQLPPPDFRRKDCNAANPCDGSSAVVTVGNNGDPSVVTKNGDGTTTVCYDLSLVVSPDPNCNVGNQAMTGVSFILDECCPTPMMQYFDVVSISGGGSGSTSVSVNREACTQGDLSQTMETQCTRTSRMCATNPSQKCTVLNLNNLDVKPGRTVQYCIKVQGENFAAVSPPNTLDPSVKGIAKFCFESGSTSPSGPTNVCTCTQVGFIESPRLCNATASPTQNPTPNPTATPTKNPTNSPSASPTRNPSPNPTSSPTRNPTTCLSRDIPDFTGKDCTDTTTCSGLNAIVKVTGSTVVANQGSGTTKLCYQMALNNDVGSCAVGNVPVRGISFVTDECCPAPNMEFLDTVSVTSSTGSTQYNRVECVKGVLANAFDKNCARTTRSCVSKPLSNCSVLNVNNLNVSGPNFEYCVEIAGTNYDAVTPGTIDPSAAGQAKICFERGESVPPGSNICSCVEVAFPRSTRICQVTPLPTKSPTKNPTKNPTANPTLSPTTCKQSEVPSFPRKDCSEANGCSGSSAIVTVGNGGEPTATSDGNGTTTVCYDLNLVANPDGSCSSAGNEPMTGVSFIIDECCPTPMMEYFETVSISGGGAGSAAVSVNREECTEGSAVQTMNGQCTRTRRTCQSDSTQQCTVLNLNNLAVNPGATAKYCIKVQGEFDVKVPIGQLDPDVKGKAKFCFERGSTNPSGPINVCTCVEVGFIESPRLCQATFPPTPFPTPTPDCLIPPVFPRPRPCNFSCNFSSSNWNVSLVDRVVSSDVNGDISTTFTYSASSLRKYSTRKSDSSNGGTARGRRGWASSTDSKPKRRLGWSTTAKPSKKVSLKVSSESKDGRPSSKKVSSKKVSAGSGSAASKKTSKSNDKPSKKTSSKKTSKGQQSGSKKIQSKKVLKKVSKKISKKQKTPPCEAYLNKWVLRLDECCGVGVLKHAVASGLVKVSVNGKACKRTRKCKIRSNGQNGDVIVVYGMKSTLSITMQGDVKLTRGGSVCAQGGEACACKPMMTPNTCLLPTRSPTVKPTMNPSPPPTRKTARPTKVWKRMSKDASKGSKKQDGKNKGDKAGKKLKQSGGNGGSGKKRKSSSGKKDTDRMKPTTKKHY